MEPNATAGVIGAVIGAVVTAAGTAAVLVINARGTDRRADRDQSLKEHQDLIDRLEARGERQDEEVRAIRSEMAVAHERESRCQQQLARAAARIESLEDALAAAGIPFRRWADPGSDLHRPLPPGGTGS